MAWFIAHRSRAFDVILDRLLVVSLFILFPFFIVMFKQKFLHDIYEMEKACFMSHRRGSHSRTAQVKLCRFYLRACVMEINIILDNLSFSLNIQLPESVFIVKQTSSESH